MLFIPSMRLHEHANITRCSLSKKFILKCRLKGNPSPYEEEVGNYHSICLVLWFKFRRRNQKNKHEIFNIKIADILCFFFEHKTLKLGRARSHNGLNERDETPSEIQ